jgi:aminocarboxymuconate-semialdehyde decarboxylase
MAIARRAFLTGLAAVGGGGLLQGAERGVQRPAWRYAAPVFDAHMHWYPPEFASLLEKEGEANGAAVSRTASGELNVKVPGGQYYSPGGSTFRHDMTDPRAILAAADERQVDVSVLTQTNPHVVWAPPAFGLKLSRAINDGNAALHTEHPKRFLGTITLPMQDPALALQELERGARLPGMRAVNVTENVQGENLSQKRFWPVWERCEALGLPLFLHNVNPIHERLVEQDFSMMNVLGNAFEATIAATALVLGGVMDAFPKLDVYLPHAGGFFPFAVPRIDFAMSQGNFKNVKQPARAYLRRFHYDLILHSPALTRTLIDLVGVDRVVSGTDFPQGMGIKHPVDYVEAIPGITKREAEMILCENPARLLKA